MRDGVTRLIRCPAHSWLGNRKPYTPQILFFAPPQTRYSETPTSILVRFYFLLPEGACEVAGAAYPHEELGQGPIFPNGVVPIHSRSVNKLKRGK